MTAHLDLSLEQMDVTTAFLHSELVENILMEEPKEFEVRGKME